MQACGEFEGRPFGSVEVAAKAAGCSTRTYKVEGGESWDEVQQRAGELLERCVPSWVASKAAAHAAGARPGAFRILQYSAA